MINGKETLLGFLIFHREISAYRGLVSLILK